MGSAAAGWRAGLRGVVVVVDYVDSGAANAACGYPERRTSRCHDIIRIRQTRHSVTSNFIDMIYELIKTSIQPISVITITTNVEESKQQFTRHF